MPIAGEMPRMTPTDFIAVLNQTLEYAYSNVTIVGEVASFKVSQGKWVFFDIKDDESSLPCFMTLWSMRQPIEDGMKVVVRGVPKMTKWGKFSLTVNAVQPVGEGSLKKAYEILKKKLADEGLFDPARKRKVPQYLDKIGVISSTGAAGYADFIKIINARWGGMKVLTANTQVQGMDAPDQIIRALKYFNERTDVQVIAILRGGGSADDLSCFNDEQLVRAVAASKIPVIVGVGHEVDESLCDLAADIRASTPSNAAEMLTPDRNDIAFHVGMTVDRLADIILNKINDEKKIQQEKIRQIKTLVDTKIANYRNIVSNQLKMLLAQNPEKILKQGYAIISGKISPGETLKITTYEQEITTLIQEITKRSKDE